MLLPRAFTCDEPRTIRLPFSRAIGGQLFFGCATGTDDKFQIPLPSHPARRLFDVPDIARNSAAAVANQLMQGGPSSCGRALHHTLCGLVGSGYLAQSLGGSKVFAFLDFSRVFGPGIVYGSL